MLAQQHIGPRARRGTGWLPLAAGVGLLAGCAPQRAVPPDRPPAPAVAEPTLRAEAIPHGARAFRVDPELSEVSIKVYRAGPLARLGHNHVVTSGHESGYAWLGSTPADSGFEVRLRPEDFVVDDPAARRGAGSDFAVDVPAEAREGTRRNMLSVALLDAERYPWIVVRADRLSGGWDRASVTASITIKDAVRTVDLPVAVEVESDRLTARGTTRLTQSELGLVPFSVAGGAIQVADVIELEFTFVAIER